MLDVVQISYNEEQADENFEILQMFAPDAKRIIGVKGIFNAHQAAAEIAETNHFYVNKVLPCPQGPFGLSKNGQNGQTS